MFWNPFIFQKKEPIGDDDTLPDTITSNILGLVKETCAPLTVFQLKKVRSLIDEAIANNNQFLEKEAKDRDATLREMGNWLHPSVPVSNDEVGWIFDFQLFFLVYNYYQNYNFFF